MPTTEKRLKGLLHVAGLLNAQLEVGKLLATIIESAAKVAQAERASLLLVDPVRGELYFDVALGLAPEVHKVRLKLGQGIAGWVAKTAQPALVTNVGIDPRWDATMDQTSGFTTRSILAVPMKAQDQVIGVIEVINKTDGVFGDEDRQVLEAFASQAAIALVNARLFQNLREEKRKFETVLAEMREGAILTDAEGRVVLANGAARGLLEIGDSNFKLEAVLVPFRLEPSMGRLFGSAEPEQKFTAVRLSPKPLHLAGTVRSYSADSEGQEKARLWLWVFRDVTEERREESLKRKFFALISHKLRTPLAAILGFCEVLDTDRTLGEQQRRGIQVITRQSRSLATLVDKLLKFTWLQGIEAVGLTKQSLPLGRIVDGAVRRFQDEVDDGVLRLERGEGLDLPVFAEAQIVSDALVYLLDNAIRFNPKPRKTVRVSAVSTDGWTEIRIADDGPGIPPEDRERIFSRFYQVEESFTGQVEGWGLGLPFVAEAMKAHGGRVRLESQLGTGTTVVLVLPEESR